jgi:hypothetical protein
MSSPALRGYVTKADPGQKAQTVYGDDGMPVTRDPILSDDQWHKVQRALGEASRKPTQARSDRPVLADVAICGSAQARCTRLHRTNY